jgi:hypothetical protein
MGSFRMGGSVGKGLDEAPGATLPKRVSHHDGSPRAPDTIV